MRVVLSYRNRSLIAEGRNYGVQMEHNVDSLVFVVPAELVGYTITMDIITPAFSATVVLADPYVSGTLTYVIPQAVTLTGSMSYQITGTDLVAPAAWKSNVGYLTFSTALNSSGVGVPNVGAMLELSDATTVGTAPIPDAGGYYTTDTINGALQEIGGQLAQNAIRTEILNASSDTEGVFDSANFAQQGELAANCPIASVLHHYTEGDAMQIDNVGESNSILVLKNANNPTRRPDKTAEFCGSGSFIELVKTSFTDHVKAEDVVFYINPSAQFNWTNTDTVQLNNAKASDPGLWAWKKVTGAVRAYWEQVRNGATRVLWEITDNGTTLTKTFKPITSLTFTLGGILKALAGSLQFINDKADDGLYGLSFSSTNSLANLLQFKNGAVQITTATATAWNSRALGFLTELDAAAITALANNTLFVRAADHLLCFKNASGTVQTVNLT